MCTRLMSALGLMIFLSVAGSAVAKMQPAAASGAETSSSVHSQDQAVPKPMEHGQPHRRSDADGNGDDQGNSNPDGDDQGEDNGQHRDRGHHYGVSRGDTDDQDAQGGTGKHNGKGHHPDVGNSGSSDDKGGSGTGAGTGVGIGPPGGGTTGSTAGSVGIPEPATVALLVLGLLGCAVGARRR